MHLQALHHNNHKTRPIATAYSISVDDDPIERYRCATAEGVAHLVNELLDEGVSFIAVEQIDIP